MMTLEEAFDEQLPMRPCGALWDNDSLLYSCHVSLQQTDSIGRTACYYAKFEDGDRVFNLPVSFIRPYSSVNSKVHVHY